MARLPAMSETPFTWFTPLDQPQERPMSTPVAVTPTLSISADKAVYNVGDVLTLTADYSDSSVAPMTLTVTAQATDPQGNTVSAETSVTVNTAEQQPMQLAASDSFGDAYSIVSNAAGVAVLTATIGSPPAPAAA